jgi:hypothetical protein
VRAPDAGCVADAHDLGAIAAHLRALDDAALRDRMGQAARRAVLPLSASAMTLKLVLLYKALLAASVAHRRRPAAAAAPPP